MQKIDTQKGAISLILSIVIVLAVVGGGAYLYTKNSEQKDNLDIKDVQTYSVDDPIFANSPKGLFLERNEALYNAGSFDELMSASSKYDTEARKSENEALFKEANKGKKDAYFSFAQALLIPNSSFTSISEKIEGDMATVTALDNKGQKTTAVFIREGGEWKLDDIKTLLTGQKN